MTPDPVCILFEKGKVVEMIDALDEALAPPVPFSEDHDAMRKAADRRRTALVNKVLLILRDHRVSS